MTSSPANNHNFDELDAILDDGPDAHKAATQGEQGLQPDSRRARRAHAIEDNGDLGIDEQIKVRKPRAPVAKLDEERLLSEKGVPRLRRITKDKLKFKGKGHEFSDVARLLATYQLWLDDLFPKANFADGLELIEKVGHKKRLAVMRREWINEDRPKATLADDDGDGADENEAGNANTDVALDQTAMDLDDDALFVPDNTAGISRPGTLGALEPQTREDVVEKANTQPAAGPEEDELDALLAADAAMPILQPSHQANADEFADEMEAMDDLW